MAEQFPIDMMNEGNTKNWTKVGLAFYETKNPLIHIVESDWSAQNTKPNQKRASEADIYYLLKFINKNEEKYPNQEFQRAAKKLCVDRNNYVHDLIKAQVTDEKQEKFKEDMLNLLRIVERLCLTDKATLAKQRIEEIFRLDYVVVSEDKYKARMADFEGRLLKFEFQIEEEKRNHQDILQIHEEEFKSIKSLRESSGGDLSAGDIIKERFDKAERDLMKVINDQEKRITTLESHVYEIKEQQGRRDTVMGYLLMKDPEILGRQRSQNHVESLTANDNWDPTSRDATYQLTGAANRNNQFLFNLLIARGVSLSMADLPLVTSAEGLEFVIEHLRQKEDWKPQSPGAIEAFDAALLSENSRVLYILSSNGVQITRGGGCD